MSHLKRYTKSYYQEIQLTSIASAKVLVPLIKTMIDPGSIADVGCGTGIWLKEWEEQGVHDYIGLDGDYIKEEQLVIPKEKFIGLSLDEGFRLSRKYELVVCLEVAEHILPLAAKRFIDSLCTTADVILFSAAIPGQGGLNHLNEQYPEYWTKLFQQNGFSAYDCIREKVWLNPEVDACYRQNIVFYVKDDAKQQYPSITTNGKPLLPIVHPLYFEDKKQEIAELRRILKNPFRIFLFYARALWRRLHSKQLHNKP